MLTARGGEALDLLKAWGAHFGSRYFLTLLWLPRADGVARTEAWLHENRSLGAADRRAALEGFIDRADRECRPPRPVATRRSAGRLPAAAA